MADIYFWRQILVLTTFLLYSYSIGFTIGFPAVLNPVITSPNSTDIQTTADHASWIASAFGIGGFFGALGQPAVVQLLGRKLFSHSSNVSVFVGWVIVPFAMNITALYASRLIQGLADGAIYTKSIVVSEYVHPTRRGYFTALQKVIMAFGTLSCHGMSAFWTWRQIGIFASVFPLAAIVLTFFWPESPSYLAMKGRFTECEKSFKWLNGNSEESQKHLNSLLEAQKIKLETNKTKIESWATCWKTFLKKDFQRAFFVSSVLTLCIDLSGRYYFGAFAIQIMMELLDNKASAFYFTILADIFTVTALGLSSVVISYYKRRTILLSSGVFAVILMLTISVLVYLKTVYTFSKYFHWFTALVIVLQTFVVNIGLIPVAFVITSEIFPLENRGLGACASGVMFTFLFASIIKLTPVLMEHAKLYGTYAIYGACLAICLVYLYKAVPETKDKTLQEIEDDLNCIQRKEIITVEGERLMPPNKA